MNIMDFSNHIQAYCEEQVPSPKAGEGHLFFCWWGKVIIGMNRPAF